MTDSLVMMQNLTFFSWSVLHLLQLVDVCHTRNSIDSVVLYQIQEKSMKIFNQFASMLIMICLLPLFLSACGQKDAVSYSRDVSPILTHNCLECHKAGGSGLEASGFSMETYGDLMKGTAFGPMIIAGDSEGSNLLVLMEGRADPSISMPHGEQDPIPKQDIETIRLWIDQGAREN
jgi:hypothetical protein